MSLKRVLFAAGAAGIALVYLAVSAFAWEPRIEGKPKSLAPGSTAGFYFWHDDGLHLWTTDPENREARYTGTIVTNGRFVNPGLQRPENDDHFKVSDPKNCLIVTDAAVDDSAASASKKTCTMTFSFHTYDGIDGVNFHIAGGGHVKLDLYRDGRRISKDNIFLGEDSVHPAHNPFEVDR